MDGNQKKCGGAGGEKSKEMWRFGGRNRNVVVVGGGGGGKTIEMWWLYIASLFKKLCLKKLSVGSM